MGRKIKKRFKQYTEDNLRMRRIKKESRHNAKVKLEEATVNENWDDLDYETESSVHHR
jgi:hypothetical protein